MDGQKRGNNGAGRGARSPFYQVSLKKSVECAGTGLHTGKSVRMTLNPAAPESGIVFVRTDVVGEDNRIPATWDRVIDTRMNTRIANENGVSVGTIEHLLAALAGQHIDNVEIEIDGPEVPVMDGSSSAFVKLLDEAGIEQQLARRKALRIKRPVHIRSDKWEVSLSPDTRPSLRCEIDFSNDLIGRQVIDVPLVNGTFARELAYARTFGFLEEVEAVKSLGLARGGSLDNAVVVDGETVLNEEGLRCDDEFVRHKALDALGDLYLAGLPVIGRFVGIRSGHTAHNALLRELFKDPEAWDIVYFPESAVEDDESSLNPFRQAHGEAYAVNA